MVSVKILNINCRYTTDTNVALPFDTDAQVLAAWDYIMANGRADSFRYDPEVEGEDPDRAWMDQFLTNRWAGNPQPAFDADQVRRTIPKIWGAEMNYDIRELLGVEA
ncbi:hypothetical protein [Paenarthrobacter sp. YJN-5]|uniref:hypothetical protein n=1 Tax=Paenarthrobacter sp. YJN-5 TaxID=2735316 RepID=UPI001878571B|nr:hypothetical protein [Paenarthrobacter sp. YJN-5]QOT19716.1 hypothetical protein HMI59_23800 [Paenarthrobacter sp. YJN-5]